MNDIELAQSCVNKQIKALTQIYDNLESNEYGDLYRSMKDCHTKCSKIILCGVGKNAPIASKISASMASLGIRSMPLDAGHYLHGDAGYIDHNDLVIYISKSGKTAEILKMSRHLNDTRPLFEQYIIHANPELQPDHFMKHYCIGKVEEGDYNEVAPTTSTTAFLCLLDSLTVVLSNELKFSSEDFLAFHPGGTLGETLNKSLS